MALRYDRGELTTKAERLPNGMLRAPAFLTRAGVFVYRDAQGNERRELRHPDDVFDPASLASLQLVVVTDGHPTELVTAANAKALGVGHVGENIARADGDLVGATLMLTSAPAIDAVLSGVRRELSCGYEADVVDERGVFDGEPYDARQKNIRYNHVAIVEAGRAGPLVRVRLDADSMAQVSPESSAQDAPGEPSMSKVRIRNDGLTIELDPDQVSVFEQITQKLTTAKEAAEKLAEDNAEEADEAKQKLADAEQKAQQAQAQADAAKAELDELRKTHADAVDPVKLRERISSRVALETQARAVLGADAKLDELDDVGVRRVVLGKLSPGVKLDDKTEAYIVARYDAAIEFAQKQNPGLDALRRSTAPTHADSANATGDVLLDAARKAREDSAKLWQQPLAASKTVGA